MPRPGNSPAYGLLRAENLSAASRRRFLQTGALMIGFVWVGTGKALARGPRQLDLTEALKDDFKGFAPGGFIRIPREGKITFIIPSTEMGQGVYTSDAMLIAEELEVGLDQIDVVAAPPNEKLYSLPLAGSQSTGGSTSTIAAWEPLRKAGAAARIMLVRVAAQRWGSSPESCFAERGVVHCRATGRSAPYGALVDMAVAQPVPSDVPLKSPDQFKLIGRAVPRLDTPDKVTGTARYGIDVTIPGMKVALLEMCPVQGGKLVSLDDRAARRSSGVVDVLRTDDAVAVVADHFWAARRGLEMLDIRWDEGANATLSSDAMHQALRYAAENDKPVMGREAGDIDQAMRNAHETVEAVYELPMLAHATMEPLNTTVHVRPDMCEIWVGTQAPVDAQKAAAKILGVPDDRVRLHNHLIGGGFGRRLAVESIAQAVQFARQVPYPLKLIQTREQDIQHDLFRPAYYDQIAAGLGPDGLPTVLTDRIGGGSVLQTYLPEGLASGTIDPDAIAGAVDTPYSIPNWRVDWIRKDPPIKLNWWRGVGPTHNVFVIESFIDELAHRVVQDSVKYRRRLLKRSPRALQVLNIAAERGSWNAPLPPRCGRGICLHHNFGSYIALVCEVSVSHGGQLTLRRLTAAVDVGLTVNPNTVEAQIEGGVLFGLSAAMFNGITFSNGRVVQSNFNDYRQIRINEVPPIDVQVVKSAESPGGVGELGTAAAAAALGNAIFAATGQRLRRLPFDTAMLAEKGAYHSVAAAIGLGALALGAAGYASPKGDLA